LSRLFGALVVKKNVLVLAEQAVSGFSSCLQQQKKHRYPSPLLYMLTPDLFHNEDLGRSAKEK
jgi:hypothetical protein